MIACYNEDGYMLENSLESLYSQTVGSDMDILIVCDGIKVMANSMQQTLRKLFGKDVPVDEGMWHHAAANTCIIQQGSLNLVLKRNNFRKMNSHEWYLRAFALQSQYCILMDCAIQLDKHIVATFREYMEAHPNAVGLTGRRRTMTYQQQSGQANEEHPHETWQGSCLRWIQTWMFEEENNSLLASSDACGVLTCIHGPFGFFRFPSMNSGNYLNEYFRLAYARPAEVGLIMGNVKIAEDRLHAVFSLYQVDNPNATTKMVEGPGSYFYFDIEETWEHFTAQRRRWNNVNLATLVYFLFGAKGQPKTVWESRQSIFRKLGTTIILLILMVTQLATYFQVVVYAATFYHCNRVVWGACLGALISRRIADTVLGMFLGLYVVFVAVHTKRQGKSDTSFSGPLWALAYVFNAVNMLIATVSIPICVIGLCHRPEDHDIKYLAQLLVVIFGSYVLVLLLLLYMDSRYFLQIFRPQLFIYWCLSCPTAGAFLYTYSIIRYPDLTWGNRPGGEDLAPLYTRQTEQAKPCKVHFCREPICCDKSNVCANHAWLSQRIHRLHFVVVVLVLVNASLGLLLSHMEGATKYLLFTAVVVFTPLLISKIIAIIADAFWALQRIFHCFRCGAPASNQQSSEAASVPETTSSAGLWPALADPNATRACPSRMVTATPVHTLAVSDSI